MLPSLVDSLACGGYGLLPDRSPHHGLEPQHSFSVGRLKGRPIALSSTSSPSPASLSPSSSTLAEVVGGDVYGTYTIPQDGDGARPG